MHLSEDEIYQGYMSSVYGDACGFQKYSLQQQKDFMTVGVCATYGELLYPSVKQLMIKLKKDKAQIFLDLGSGLGKCSLQIFMQTDYAKVIGIEASASLHEQALQASQKITTDFPFFWQDDRDLIFVNENFLQADWQGATTVYTCSTCFTQELLLAIAARINIEPTVNQVFSLRPLPFLRLPLQEVFTVECSWDSALCYFYGG